jgi:hypothetical protein
MTMIRSRNLRKVVVAFGGAAMLVVQITMAAQACMLQADSGAPASVAAPRASEDQAPCHEMDGSAPENHYPQRCDAVKQAPDHQPISFTPLLSAIHPVEPSVPHSTVVYDPKEPRALLARATAPPLPVRNCCFRT